MTTAVTGTSAIMVSAVPLKRRAYVHPIRFAMKDIVHILLLSLSTSTAMVLSLPMLRTVLISISKGMVRHGAWLGLRPVRMTPGWFWIGTITAGLIVLAKCLAIYLPSRE